MRVLAIDYGTRSTGLAITDELQLTARPLATIRSTARRASSGAGGRSQSGRARALRSQPFDLPREILHYVAEYEVGLLLIGLPLNMDGSRGEAARRVDRLIDKLRQLTEIPILTIDERLTSRAADELLRAGGASQRERRERSDEYAALIILEDYLASPRLPRSSPNTLPEAPE